MPQIQLPIFPAGCIDINGELGCRTEGDDVFYFNGHLPIFTHPKDDVASFRMFTSQLIIQGSATQGQIARAFGVPLITIKRSTKLFRARGAAGFFVPKPRRQGTKLKDDTLERARSLILEGHPLAVVSERSGVLIDTLRKAVGSGRLPAPKKRPRKRP